jgi:putative aldouronate transport system permease protein
MTQKDSMTQKNTGIYNIKHKKRGIIFELVTNKVLYLMILPGLIFLAVFSYYPILGAQIAFKDYNVLDGIWKSPFVGFKWFEVFFKSNFAGEVTFNTLYLNFLFITTGTLLAITIAILLNEVVNSTLRRVFQSLMFFPYFLSWVTVSAIVYSFLNYGGALNTILQKIGIEPHTWYNMPELWRGILTVINAWQSYGYAVVIYLAVIVSIDKEMYESAKIDGANKFHEIFKITIPHLIPTVVLLTLIAVGRIFYGNFAMIYSIIGDSNGMLIRKTDIIDTFVFRAMKLNGDFSMATAVGLYQSVLGFALVIICNKLVKRYDSSMGLF